MGTIGVDYRWCMRNIADKTVKLQVWDTPGRERFRTISSTYFRSADGIFVVYDVMSRDSFDQVKHILAEVEKYADANVRKMLIGNKSDVPRSREVSKEEGLALALERGMTFLEASALTGENVELALSGIVTQVLAVHAAGRGVRASAAAVKPPPPLARFCTVC